MGSQSTKGFSMHTTSSTKAIAGNANPGHRNCILARWRFITSGKEAYQRGMVGCNRFLFFVSWLEICESPSEVLIKNTSTYFRMEVGSTDRFL